MREAKPVTQNGHGTSLSILCKNGWKAKNSMTNCRGSMSKLLRKNLDYARCLLGTKFIKARTWSYLTRRLSESSLLRNNVTDNEVRPDYFFAGTHSSGWSPHNICIPARR